MEHRMVTESRYLAWFRRVMALGILSNLVVAVLSIAATDQVLGLLKLPPAEPLVWPRFAAFLLILLSGFYVPAAIDPARNLFAAVFATICRFGGVGFFSIIGGGYIVFGLFDFTFGLPEAVLLALAYFSRPKIAP
jgi:hypothetical protein